MTLISPKKHASLGVWFVVLLVLVLLGSGHVAVQRATSAEAERRIAGTWELTEWHFDGQVLNPPVVNGRVVFHDGQVVSVFSRDKDGTTYDSSGYGSYSLNRTAWSYGYERRVELTRRAGENIVAQSTREQIPHTYRFEGSNLVLDYHNGERRFVFAPDESTYIEKGQVLRKWRRLKGAQRVE